MRALWSARVSRSPSVSITMRSTCGEQASSRQAWRASCAAPALVAFGEQRAGERETALGGDRLGGAEERPHGREIAPLVPQARFRCAGAAW